jgi:hypothetical protein
MAVAQKPEGDDLGAMLALTGSRDVIMQQLLKFEEGSKEYKQCMKALKALIKLTGKSDDDTEPLKGALLKHYLTEAIGPKAPPSPQPPGQPAPQPMGAQPLGPGAPMGGMPPH